DGAASDHDGDDASGREASSAAEDDAERGDDGAENDTRSADDDRVGDNDDVDSAGDDVDRTGDEVDSTGGDIDSTDDEGDDYGGDGDPPSRAKRHRLPVRDPRGRGRVTGEQIPLQLERPGTGMAGRDQPGKPAAVAGLRLRHGRPSLPGSLPGVREQPG